VFVVGTTFGFELLSLLAAGLWLFVFRLHFDQWKSNLFIQGKHLMDITSRLAFRLTLVFIIESICIARASAINEQLTFAR
jgi:uncharacterized membrane protein